MKQTYAMIGVLAIVSLTAAISFSSLDNENKPDKEMTAVATFYPFHQIASNVAGDTREVETLVPYGAEPHSYNPSPGDIAKASNSELFIATGASLGEWEDRILEEVSEDRTVDASTGITLIDAENKHEHDHGSHENEEEGHHEEGHEEHENNSHQEEGHDEEKSHGNNHGQLGKDPHYWVSPKNAITITETVRDSFIEADRENAKAYRENSEEYIQRLEKLDSDYEERLSNCKKERILTTHAAFAYLAEDYGFKQVPILGLSPVSEPTPKQIEELVHKAEEHEIDYVFYETLTDTRVSETIAEEADAETLVLDPAAGTKEGKTYIEIMEDNLDNLEVAMECQP